MAPGEVVDPLIYDGLVEELVEVLEMKGDSIQVQEVGGAWNVQLCILGLLWYSVHIYNISM